MLPQVAFYYPGHLWEHTDWVKNLLVFFDGVALLTPVYKQHEPEILAPELAGPLRDRGLLHYLVAETTVDKTATVQLESALSEIIRSGKLDHLAHENTAFHTLSR